MNILILGATGRVGREIVALALRERLHVTALVRTPAKMKYTDENLILIQGNALNKDDIRRSIHGIDVVVSALSTDGTTTLSESMPLIMEAMKTEGKKRLVTIGTAGILQSRTSPAILRYQASESKRKSTRAAEEHHKVYNMLKQSDLEWTIVCPAYLSDGERMEKYREERDFLPEGGSVIAVSDTAEFTYRQIHSSEYIKSRVGISY